MVQKAEVLQINIRIRKSTKARLEAAAEEDRRSMADQADVLLVEALDARAAAVKTKKAGKA